jgi:large subunit ribosomal protein L22
MATLPVVPQMIEGRALARYTRVSPQKARLVIDLIRGQSAEQALVTLRFTKKRIARDIEKILRSAIANAERKAEDSGAQLDVDHLYVSQCFVNEGSRWKRVRPAPFGRAFRYQKRTSHIHVTVAERHRAAAQRVADMAAEAERSKGVRGAVRRARKAIAGKPAAKAAKTPKAPKPSKPSKKDQE